MATIRAAIYARVSTKPQAGEDKVSIPDQVRECRAFITKEGWLCAGEFVDPGISANTIDRPGLQQLLHSMDSFDVVIAWDFDRFYRERRSVAGYILDTLDEANKQISSLKQPIPIYEPAQYDPRENDTPYMLREMAGFTSGIDNRRRYRTLRKGLQERFRQGAGTHAPAYGYRLAYEVRNSKVVKLPWQIVPEQAEVIRRIYREYASGKPLRTIAIGLNGDRIRSPKGVQWKPPVLGHILLNPTYCGKVYRRTLNKRRLPDGEWMILPGTHKAIIAESVWKKVQASRHRRRPVTRAVGSPRILSGLLKCGYCDSGMYLGGRWSGGYYQCGQYRETGQCQRNSYPRTSLERDVLSNIFKIIRSEELFETATKRQTRDGVAETQAELMQLEKLRAGVPERRRRLIELYENAAVELAEFAERRDELQTESAALAKRIAETKVALDRLEAQEFTREQFDVALATLEQGWDTCEMTLKKSLLRSIIDRIVITDRSFRIHLLTAA